MRILLALICLAASFTNAFAARAEFKFLRTVTVAELNTMLDAERTAWLTQPTPVNQGEGYVLPPPAQATNDVNLFTVRYFSSIPEQGGKEIAATGLLALPKIANRANIPLLSYQHGTVMAKSAVPSLAFKADSPGYAEAYETRLMVGLFAGNGYAVMAPDLFGMGGGARFNEAYFMKQSSAQANYDMYLDVISFLANNKGIVPGKFLLGGWSQGGLNTTGFLEKLEAEGVAVRAAFTAASPVDPLAALNAALYHPRAADARWMSVLYGLTTFSCERYLGIKGLAKKVLNPDYYDQMKSLYERTYDYPTGLGMILYSWSDKPFSEFLRPAYLDPAYLTNSDYGKCLASGETYRQEFKTPLRMYYGSVDEVVRPKVGLLARDYQAVITDTPDAPSSSKIKAIRVEGGGHRLTFVSASNAAKAWMDSLR